MRTGLVDLLDALRGSRGSDLRRVVSSAGLDGEPPQPEPDVVEPFRWFVARLGDGVKLTAAGYLPPALIAETMHALGWDADWPGAGNREGLTVPVATLRDTARRLGLVRVHRSHLVPTAVGRRPAEDPAALWWQIAAWLPLAREHTDRVAGMLWLLAVAAGGRRPEAVVAEGLGVLGWVSARTGRPLGRDDAFLAVRDTTWVVFDGLGVLGTWRDRDEPPTPFAVALARAALLHEDPPAPAKVVPAVELAVSLRDVDPPVWRRLLVPERATLRDLTGLLQAAMGWQGAHLSMFELDGRPYGDVEDTVDLGDPRLVRIGSLDEGTAFRWDYDFGDGWEHDVRVGAHRTAEAPTCLDGARACPPEDSGGRHGYTRLLEVLADPRHPEHQDAVNWVGGRFDPERFDPVAATGRMRRALFAHRDSAVKRLKGSVDKPLTWGFMLRSVLERDRLRTPDRDGGEGSWASWHRRWTRSARWPPTTCSGCPTPTCSTGPGTWCAPATCSTPNWPAPPAAPNSPRPPSTTGSSR